MVVAWYLQQEGLKVLVSTGLMETCRELGIETRFPDEVKEDWSEEKESVRS